MDCRKRGCSVGYSLVYVVWILCFETVFFVVLVFNYIGKGIIQRSCDQRFSSASGEKEGYLTMKHYKISEFAAMVGLPQSRIRFYEKYGLFEVKRSKNGYRYYTPEDAFRVNAFRMLLQYGFTVERAIQMLDEKQSGDVFLNSLMTQKVCLT